MSFGREKRRLYDSDMDPPFAALMASEHPKPSSCHTYGSHFSYRDRCPKEDTFFPVKGTTRLRSLPRPGARLMTMPPDGICSSTPSSASPRVADRAASMVLYLRPRGRL